MSDMQCMMQTAPNVVLLGGHQPEVIELDLNTQQEIRQVKVSDIGCAILRPSQRYICAGDTSGKVRIPRDSRDFTHLIYLLNLLKHVKGVGGQGLIYRR